MYTAFHSELITSPNASIELLTTTMFEPGSLEWLEQHCGEEDFIDVNEEELAQPTNGSASEIAARRKRYVTLGYEPIPCNGKAPVQTNWQNINIRAVTTQVFPNAQNTGIRTRYTPAVDIDIYDEAMVEQVRRELLNIIRQHGSVLERIGQPPKVLIPFQCDVPFKKCAVMFKSPNGQMHKVEVLADGQQFIAEGIHPGTGKPYFWRDNTDLIGVEREQLPTMDQALAHRFLTRAANIMTEAGWIEVDAKGRPKAKTDEQPGSKLSGDGPVRNSAYARAALDNECKALADMSRDSGRNNALNTAAFKLGELVGGGELDMAEAVTRLFEAARTCGLVDDDGTRSVRATMESGLRAGLKQPRGTPGNDADDYEAFKTKTNGPDQQAKTEAGQEESATELGEWDAGDDIETPPPREWLLGNIFARKFMSSLLADGGVGKTSLRYAQLMSCALGRSLTGDYVFRRSRVLIVSLEDDADELRRRIRALLLHYNIDRSELKGWLYLSAPGAGGGKLMTTDKNGRLERGSLATNLEEVIVARNIDIVSIDPFVKSHSVEENNNSAVDDVVQVLTDLAVKYNIAIDAPHHTSKGTADPGNASRGRGASAMKDAARLVYTLVPMSVEEARGFGVAEEELACSFGWIPERSTSPHLCLGDDGFGWSESRWVMAI